MALSSFSRALPRALSIIGMVDARSNSTRCTRRTLLSQANRGSGCHQFRGVQRTGYTYARAGMQTHHPPPPCSKDPVFSKSLVKRISKGLLDNIDLLVCDMAGTTVSEGGVVYNVLRESMGKHNVHVTEEEMHPWHGAKKESVIEHFLVRDGHPKEEINEKIAEIGDTFLSAIDVAYFDDASPVEPIDLSLIQYMQMLQIAGVKVALDTGYPREIQDGLMKKLKFDQVVDASVSAYEVRHGRPYPYMIFRLMEDLGVMNVRRVAKAGDSVRDMEEGRNAGCGLVIGVLSGADSEKDLLEAGADVIVSRITDIPVPGTRMPLPLHLTLDLS